MIKWSETYATGMVLIDEQHKKLFEYLNDLENEVTESTINDIVLSGAFDFFENYIKTHFDYEEGCMYRYQCPIADTNQVAHQFFVNAFDAYKKRFEREGASYALYQEMIHFCEHWILQHICRIDLQLKSWVEKGKPADTPHNQ